MIRKRNLLLFEMRNGQPKEVKEFENYKIMIYNYDLSSKIQK